MLLLADCAICAANNTSGGWFILSGVVLLGSFGLAGAFMWMDRRNRRSWHPGG